MAEREHPDGRELAALGLSSAEQRVYERLVSAPPATPDELALPGEPVAATLDGLVRKGLAATEPGPPARYTAAAPDLALEVLLRERESRLGDAYARIDELSEAYRAHLAGPTSIVVELVTGQDVVAQRIAQVWAAARHELRCLERDPPLVSMLTKPARVPAVRTLYASAASSTWDSVASEQMRIVPAVPIRLYLADDRLAVVPLEGPAGGAAILHPGGLFDAVAAIFEALWARAAPHVQPASRLVELLLAGLTDDAIARQLGVGERTIQRQIAALMRDLGATTRFQAGTQAALREAATRATG